MCLHKLLWLCLSAYKLMCLNYVKFALTHWGRVTQICVSKLTIIDSDNGLSPGRRQAIIRTNAGILLNRPLGTNFSEILCETHAFSFKKMHLKMSSAKWCLFRLGLNVLIVLLIINIWYYNFCFSMVLMVSIYFAITGWYPGVVDGHFLLR